jgi:hypothetical protein
MDSMHERNERKKGAKLTDEAERDVLAVDLDVAADAAEHPSPAP